MSYIQYAISIVNKDLITDILESKFDEFITLQDYVRVTFLDVSKILYYIM